MELEPFQLEMARLDDTQPVAAGYYRRLMKRAEGAGLGQEAYDAPMGLRLPGRNKPWIAEFKTMDSAQKQDIRLYEPSRVEDRLQELTSAGRRGGF